MFSDSSAGGGTLKIRIRRTHAAGNTVFLEEIPIVLKSRATLGMKVLVWIGFYFMVLLAEMYEQSRTMAMSSEML